MNPVTLWLPEPPTVNDYWRPWRSRMVLTDAGRQYRETVWALARTQLLGGKREPAYQLILPVFAKPVEVMMVVVWHRESAKAGDTDNRLKPLLDGLQGTVYSNDSQVGAFVMWRNDTKVRPSEVHVLVQQWSLTQMPELLLHLGAPRP